jgi:hypothetical protein
MAIIFIIAGVIAIIVTITAAAAAFVAAVVVVAAAVAFAFTASRYQKLLSKLTMIIHLTITLK